MNVLVLDLPDKWQSAPTAASIALFEEDRQLCRVILPGCLHNNFAVLNNNASSTQSALLQDSARQILEYLQGKRTRFDLPVKIQGTPFQEKVWARLLTIPYGATKSYGAIAREIGDAKKARAVGGAMRANPLPLIFPCHRVLGADGSLTGFTAGLWFKRALLELEQAHHFLS